MRVRIHRGAHEIGGNCIEVEAASGERLLLDLGRPLASSFDDEVPLPVIDGLAEPDPGLLGVLISHPHLDHYGLAVQLPAHVPVYIGAEAAALLAAAAFYSPISATLEPAGHLAHREPFRLGPFTVTPYLNDHSAFDAYSMLIEADGRRIFYTGDIRAHGRKAALFQQLCSAPPEVDVLLMEGTHVRATATDPDEQFETEQELEQRFVDVAERTKGLVAVFGSAQNLDRLVTVYRAAKRSGRTLVIDLYGAAVAAATRANIPQPGFDSLAVYVPFRQRVKVKQSGEFERVASIRSHRVFPEQLAAEPDRYMLHVPSSTCRELLRDGALDATGIAVWSLWHGYLQQESGQRLLDDLARHEVQLVHLHTSGHASIADLKRLVDALTPERVVPVHSEAGDRFEEFFPDVDRRSDGEWWEV